MPKRIFAGVIGALAVGAFIVGSVLVFGLFQDSRGGLSRGLASAPEPWWVTVVMAVTCSMVLATLVIGVRFLDFALTGRNYRLGGRWLRPTLLGCGLFFPAFVVSLTLGLNWAYRVHSHGNPDESALLALKISFFLGVAAAVIGSAVLLRRARSRQ
jgi:H+/Cl- antiporter ClcA